MKNRIGVFLFCVILVGSGLLGAVPASSAPLKANTVNVKVHDLDVLTQDGKRMKFKSDVVGDRIIAMTFTYTTCTTICPVLDAIFVQLQDLLGKKLGKEVSLVTMSIDPVTDIPPRMKQYGKKLGAKPGWLFLTGKKQDVDRILVGLDVYAADINNHPPTIFVADGRKGVWKRIYGFPAPDQVNAVIKEFENARR